MWATMTRVQASGKSLPLKQDGTMNEITSEIMSEITIVATKQGVQAKVAIQKFCAMSLP